VFINEYGKLGAEVLSYYGNNIEEATQALTEFYHGEFDSEIDFVESLYSNYYTIPDYLENYIHYEKVARDLFIVDYLSFDVNFKSHVFSCF
jgi:antirestriction protein